MRRWAGCLPGALSACHTVGSAPGGALERARFAAKSDYVDQPLNAAGRAALVAAVDRRQSTPEQGSGSLVIDSYGGAVNRVAPDHTAFIHRDQLFSVQEIAYFGAPAQAASLAWLRSVHTALLPHASGQAYQNYIDPSSPTGARPTTERTTPPPDPSEAQLRPGQPVPLRPVDPSCVTETWRVALKSVDKWSMGTQLRA